jgi:hypothetical protein
MKYFFFGAVVLLLASRWCPAQQNTINSMSLSANQNQVLTGQTGHQAPPQPSFYGGVPDTSDRVSGTPANANPMRQGYASPAPAQPAEPSTAVFLPAAGQKTPAPAPKANKTSKPRQ